MAVLGTQTSSVSYGSYAAQRSNTVNPYGSRQTASTFCPTCGGKATASAACPTCNKTATSATFSSSYSQQASAACPTCGRSGNTNSSGTYCPTCNRGGQSTATGSRLATTGTNYGQYANNAASSFNRGAASSMNQVNRAAVAYNRIG